METTLVPFATLPACATTCGPLFDANGGCVPTAVPTASPSVYASCFCAHSKVKALSTGTSGICDQQCGAADLGSIQSWFTSFCADPATFTGLPANQVTNTGGSSSTTSGAAVNPTSSSSGGGGSWISTHYQWIIFLVVMIVAIVGIWTGACFFRRRYLRRRDRQYALGKRMGTNPTTGSVHTNVGGGPAGASSRSVHIPAAGMFQPAPISSAGIYGPETEREKRGRNKWNPAERT